MNRKKNIKQREKKNPIPKILTLEFVGAGGRLLILGSGYFEEGTSVVGQYYANGRRQVGNKVNQEGRKVHSDVTGVRCLLFSFQKVL